MKIEAMEYKAKNGETVIMRSGEKTDGEQLRKLAWQAYGETRFLSKEQDEFTLTAEQETAWILRMLHEPRAVLLMAELNGEVVGDAMMHPVAESSRQRHRCQAGITVLEPHWGKGIGKGLFALLIAVAKEAGYTQMELEVVADNERAVALYKKLGFVEYGRRPNSFHYRDGSYADMLLMVLDLCNH